MYRKRIATIALVIAMFLNPIGFDAIQLTLMSLIGSYLGANIALYCLSALFFGLYIFLSKKNSKKSSIALIIAMFFNPFGFDAIQLLLMKLTGTYLYANLCLYMLSSVFFLIHFYFAKVNPLKKIKNRFSKLSRLMKN